MQSRLVGWMLIATGLVLMLLALGGCASSGLYQMSDEYCAKHPSASPTRCQRNPLRQVDIQGHERGTAADMCPGQYTEYVYTTTPLYCWGSRS